MAEAADLGDALRSVLDQTPGIVSAYVFGSAASDRMHRESDVDVGVLLDWNRYPSQSARFDARLRLITALQSAIGREVDLVILNEAPPHLTRRIMCEGLRITVREPELDHSHLRTTLSRAADLEPFLRRTRAVKLEALRR